MSTESTLDTSRCPVCGLANQCAVAAASTLPCWCASAEIPKAALERIPEAAVDKACLCPRCALLTPDGTSAPR